MPADADSGRGRPVEQAFAIACRLAGEGATDDAEALCELILTVTPDHYGALFRLGTLRARAGRLEDAAGLLRRAAAVRPGTPDAACVLGLVLAALGRPDEAFACYRAALAADPGHAGTLTALGTALSRSGRGAEAIACLTRAVAAAPDDADVNFMLANVLQAQGRFREATAHYGKVLRLAPRHAAALSNFGTVLQKLGRLDDAIALYRHALAVDPGFTDASYNLGTAHLAAGRNEDAIVHSEHALRADPSRALAHNNIGIALQALGRSEEAAAAYRRSIALAPRQATTHLNFAYLRRFTPGDPRLADLERLAADPGGLDVENRIAVHFALGKAYDDLADPARAFAHLRNGNALKRAETAYDEAAELGLLQRTRAVFTPGLMRDKRGAGDPSQVPVFVVGMPRSGTTLLEHILASHSAVHGAGEIETFHAALAKTGDKAGNDPGFPDMVPATTAEALRELGAGYVAAIRTLAPQAGRIVNKLPLNFRYPGLIHLALPGARIVHIRRDPLDTCFSCFSLLFSGSQPFTYDLGELGRYYRGYAALMAHWRAVLPEGVMIEVRYEDLVADLAGETRRVLAHCGLAFEDACLAFHESGRPVQTASAVQVRKPVYRTAVGRWRPYRNFLAPLISALDGGEAPVCGASVAAAGG